MVKMISKRRLTGEILKVLQQMKELFADALKVFLKTGVQESEASSQDGEAIKGLF